MDFHIAGRHDEGTVLYVDLIVSESIIEPRTDTSVGRGYYDRNVLTGNECSCSRDSATHRLCDSHMAVALDYQFVPNITAVRGQGTDFHIV